MRVSSFGSVSPEISNGVVLAAFSTLISCASTSIAPVGMFGLTASGRRLRTVPLTCTTYSLRIPAASACASGVWLASTTTCVVPHRSRRSMKIRPPCSRRRLTHPASVTSWPTCSGRSSPLLCVFNISTSLPLFSMIQAAPGVRTKNRPAFVAGGKVLAGGVLSWHAPSGSARDGRAIGVIIIVIACIHHDGGRVLCHHYAPSSGVRRL